MTSPDDFTEKLRILRNESIDFVQVDLMETISDILNQDPEKLVTRYSELKDQITEIDLEMKLLDTIIQYKIRKSEVQPKE